MIWLTKRGLSIAVLSVLIFIASHLIIRMIPGDPVDVIIAETGTNIPREVLLHDLQLDLPIIQASKTQFTNAIHGNFGQSIHYKKPIGPILWDRMIHSLQLAGGALLLGVSIALGLALLSNRESAFQPFLKKFGNTYSLFLAAAPSAWTAPVMSLLLCVKLGIFPVSGSYGLCVLVLGVTLSGFWVRAFTRVIESEKKRDHYRSAESRGVPLNTLLLKYGLYPASGSLLGFLGSQAGWLAAGAVIAETVFDWPGLGSLLIESILKRDYPLMEMTIALTSLLIFLGNTGGEMLQIFAQPKLREEAMG